MPKVNMGSRRRHSFYQLLTGSAAAVWLMTPGTAWADCTPDPTPANGSVTCTGSDADGLTINTNQTTVNVQAGATVSSMTATTIGDFDLFKTANPSLYPYYNYYPYAFANNITINNSGQISGGLTVLSGTGIIDHAKSPSTNVTLNVASGGSVSGATAINLIADPAAINPLQARAYISIDNSGSIQSTTGPAITGNSAYYSGVGLLQNRASGIIGAIQVPVQYLYNSGTIDGGTASALTFAQSGTTVPGIAPASWTNDGSILSTGSPATLNLQTGYTSNFSMDNSGTIRNAGTGSAISFGNGDYYMTLRNAASGVISSANGTAITSATGMRIENSGTISGSGTAIDAAGPLFLTGSGTITGSVNAGASSSAGSTIDLSGGQTINGNLTLGGGDDVVLVNYGGSLSGVPGVTGTVNAGGGTNRLTYKFASDATLGSAQTLPATFSVLGLDIAAGSTVTLDTGFAPQGLITLSSPGSATLINQASYTVAGPAFTQTYTYRPVAIDNRGALTVNLANPADTAITMGQADFTNSGSIIANGGNGINQSAGFGQFTNSGSIAASGTAVDIFDGELTNSGTITSSAGTAVHLFGNVGYPAFNSGTIRGAKVGVDVSGYTLTNAGTISSPGLAVLLEPYGSLTNQAGGVIEGDVGALSGSSTFLSTVINAGQINGNVNFGTGFGFAGNTFIALDGGVVTGNLVLGTSDRFVTSLTNSGPGAYAGVNGTVSGGGNATLIYRVDADTAASLTSPTAMFSTIGFDLSNNATLTLTGSSATAQSFSGTGTVNISGDLTGSGSSSLINLQQYSPLSANSNAITLTSSGSLTVTATNPYSYVSGLVASLGRDSSFTNSGTITVNDVSNHPAYYGQLSAIDSTDGSVTNTGSIALGGVIGLAIRQSYYGGLNLPNVSNSGSITQIAGAADAVGIEGSFTLTNTGTISTGGRAISILKGSTATTITNSGTISSAHAPAIADPANGYYSYLEPVSKIINQAGGTISGGAGQSAIRLGLGVIDNAGTINGNVDLGINVSAYQASYARSAYIARGGTLNGNLTFGAGDDTLVVVGNSTGVTGTIDAGGGRNTYAQLFTGSSSIDVTGTSLPATFQAYAIGASGADTTLTVTGPAAGLSSPIGFFGDGTIDNKANVNTAAAGQPANTVQLGALDSMVGATGGLSFVNDAVLADGVSGSLRGFTNNGTVTAGQYAIPVRLEAVAGSDFSFNNTGQIHAQAGTGTGYYYPAPMVSLLYYGAEALNSATIANSGSISDGGLYTSLIVNQLDVTNSGTISVPPGNPYYPVNALGINAYVNGSGLGTVPKGSFTKLTNSAAGTINGATYVSTTAEALTIDNAGTINGNLIGDQTSLYTYLPASPGFSGGYFPVDQLSASITNSGAINGSLSLSSSATTASIANSGTVAANQNGGGVQALVETNDGTTLKLTNSGTISNAASGGQAIVAGARTGFSFPDNGAAATLEVVNTGSLSANGGALLYSCCLYDYSTGAIGAKLYAAAGLAVGASASGAASIAITNAAGATISATGTTVSGDGQAVPSALTKVGSIGVVARADTVTLTNNGTISGGADMGPGSGIPAVIAGSNYNSALPDGFAGGVELIADSATLTNAASGVINGSVGLVTAAQGRVSNYGTINGNVTLAASDDSFVQGIGATLTGIGDGGAGTDRLIIDITGGGVLNPQLSHFINFESTHLTGSGSVATSAPLATDTLILDDAALTIAAGKTLQTSGAVTLTGGTGTISITNYGTIAGKVVLGAGDESFMQGINASTGAVDGGAGTNSLTIDVSGGGNFTQAIAPFTNFPSLAVTGTGTISASAPIDAATLTLNNANLTLASGSTLQTSGAVALTGGAGTNAFTNNGTVNGAIVGVDTDNAAGGTVNILASATNNARFTNAAADATLAIKAGTYTLGQKLINSGLVTVAGGATLTDYAGISNLAGGRITVASGGTINDAVDNAGTIVNSGTYNADLNNLAGGTATNAAGAIWTGALSNAAGATLVNQGAVVGSITNSGTLNLTGGSTVSGQLSNLAGGKIIGALAFGSGNDTLTLMSGAGVTDAIDGGAGSNTLRITSTGTDAAPDEYNLTKVTNFQQTTLTSGTIAVSGSYTTTQLDILAGRYIGRTGSTLTATTLNVASGATFGSGGTVNGNINVAGTLAPGGTVGAMTVNGNVAFASGSTALFDVGQAASDQLAVTGAVSIASGATLTLSAVQNNPLKPGSSIDLITTNGGITGSFGTINKPATILGFVVQRATKISLLGQFAVDSSFSAPVTTAVQAINSMLVSGSARPELINALPSLVTGNGNTNAAAFAQLTPEAYASASQLGTDNGLTLASALRTLDVARAPASGNLFVFGQGLGSWTRLAGSTALGTSRVRQSAGGVLGGLGYHAGPVAISGFVGTISGNQTIAALGARTTADGIVAGANARFVSGGFDAAMTFAYDSSNADTTRPVPAAHDEQAHYKLRSTTFDVNIGYSLALGKSLKLRPGVGFTSVQTKRGAATEFGSSGVFDFALARDTYKANFIDGGLRIESTPANAAALHPWLDLGLRHLLDRDARFATGYLPGDVIGIKTAGAGRARTLTTLGAGFDLAVARNVTLYASYGGAFGTGSSSSRVNGGIRMTF